MIDSKPWIWNKVDDLYWQTPAEEVIPVAKRWKGQGFNTVLDLGCGTGRHSIFLAEQGFAVNAFDLAEDGIDALRNKVKDSNLNIDIQVGDMLNLPCEPGSFDCVLSMFTIQHTDMEGLENILNNIYTALKPDGEAFITLTSKQFDAWEKNKDSRINDNTLIKTKGPEVGVPHTYLNYDEVMNLLQNFQVLKIQQIIRYLPTQKKKHAHFYILMKKK